MAVTVAAVPVVFFLTVVRSPVLACAAVLVEIGLFTASRIALKRPPKPVGAARFEPPRR